MWRVMLFLSLIGFITLANAQKDSKSGVQWGGAQSHFGPGPSVVNQVRHHSSQSGNWHGSHDTQEGHGGRHGQGHYEHHGNYHHHNNGGTSVFVPYWWYGTYPYYDDNPYYSSSRVAYPNRIFICYEEDQVYDDRYHIGCPVPISWYSTDPAYDSEDYQTQYRPEYVCPDNGAAHYVEFSNSYEANTWWNNNCNRWIFTP